MRRKKAKYLHLCYMYPLFFLLNLIGEAIIFFLLGEAGYTLLDVETERDLVWRFLCLGFLSITVLLFS